MQTPAPQGLISAEQLQSAKTKLRYSKSDSRYWLPRVYRPTNSQGKASPHYAMQVQFKGRHLTFGLYTGNREAAARRASRIYDDLGALGVEATVEKHRAKRPEVTSIATVGEYLRAARSVMSVRPVSFAGYSRHLYQIVGDIIDARGPRKARHAAIEGAPLSAITPEALQRWRLAFVARAQGDARKERSARISCNSILQQARSLFSPKVVKFLGSLKLPDPLPFTGVERFKRESQRYISRIDAGALLRKARQQLADKDPDSFLVVMLALAAGLRRGELDKLLWSNVDLNGGRIIIEDTEQGRVKSEESRGAVDIDQHTVELLRGFYARAASKFVIEGGRETRGSRRSWNRYRCEAVFDHVNWWLRRHGVKDAKPLHTLRKESGALVVSAHGIYEASRHLRHRDIAITAAHYADKKARTVVDVGALLQADEAKAENIIKLPSDNPVPRVEGTVRRRSRSVS